VVMEHVTEGPWRQPKGIPKLPKTRIEFGTWSAAGTWWGIQQFFPWDRLVFFKSIYLFKESSSFSSLDTTLVVPTPCLLIAIHIPPDYKADTSIFCNATIWHVYESKSAK
jgi:hypothetical protein